MVTFHSPGRDESSQDLGPPLGLGPDTDWAALKSIAFGELSIKIEHGEGGLDFTLNGHGADNKQIVVRWVR